MHEAENTASSKKEIRAISTALHTYYIQIEKQNLYLNPEMLKLLSENK